MFTEITISDLEQDNPFLKDLIRRLDERINSSSASITLRIGDVQAEWNAYGITIILDHMARDLPHRLAGVELDGVLVKHAYEHPLDAGLYYYPVACLQCLPYMCQEGPSASVTLAARRGKNGGASLRVWEVEAWGNSVKDANAMFHLVSTQTIKPTYPVGQ